MAEQFDPSMTSVHVTNETPVGTQDFSNVTFTLVNRPANGAVQLFQNGVKLLATTDYTISGRTITFVEAPHTDDTLACSYWF